MLVGARGHRVAHHLDHQARQVAGLAGPSAALGARQRQQLVDGVRGADAGAPDLLQRALEFFGAGAFALGQVGLHAQARQRVLSWWAASARKRFWVASESFRRVSRSLTGHQRRHFERHGAVVQRREVVGVARADAFLQLAQRLDARASANTPAAPPAAG